MKRHEGNWMHISKWNKPFFYPEKVILCMILTTWYFEMQNWRQQKYKWSPGIREWGEMNKQSAKVM